MASWKKVRREDRQGRVKLAQQLLCHAQCRDCGEICRIEKHDFRKASPPRCTSCGGMVDRVRGKKIAPAISPGAPIKSKTPTPVAVFVGPVDANGYPPEWTEELKVLIIARDKHRCRLCRRRFKKRGRLHVHHVSGNKRDCRPENLVTLCSQCHTILAHGGKYSPRSAKEVAAMTERLMLRVDATPDGRPRPGIIRDVVESIARKA